MSEDSSIWRYLNQRLVVYSIERKPLVGVNGYLQKIVIENDDRLIKHLQSAYAMTSTLLERRL